MTCPTPSVPAHLPSASLTPAELGLALLAPGVPASRPALLDDARTGWMTWGELRQRVAQLAKRLGPPHGLVFLYANNSAEAVAAWLGALAAGHAVVMLDGQSPPAVRQDLEARYQPEWRIDIQSGTATLNRHAVTGAPLNPALALLLSTSGSTGSPKLVRLSAAALLANAHGIRATLGIAPDDVAAGHLPLHYSYGLSVLTSHLAAGAAVRLTALGMTDSRFWAALRETGVTHLPGVPFHYQVMFRRGLVHLNLPSLRTLTQAGGSLSRPLRTQAHAVMDRLGGRFHVMYGQTEAGPRMTTLSHAAFAEAPGSVGQALPGCRIEIAAPDSRGHGSVVFHGPNVMMGYATARTDLGLGDLLGGRLETGDLGFLDSQGRLTLTGRANRIGKIHGLRIGLDDVEMLCNGIHEAAVVQAGETLRVCFVTCGDTAANTAVISRMQARLATRLRISPRFIGFHAVDAIPRTARGKVDYGRLSESVTTVPV